jgi:cyclopropane fatty-acyl-phospholipid synthase-like methyltransferase
LPYSKKILGQLAHPSGPEGKRILDHLNKVNSNINRLTLEGLSLEADDRLLEIGFGGGALISEVMRINPKVRVFGVDISALAVELATQRFKSEICSGTASFLKIDDRGPPFNDDFFDKIATVNVIYFVSDIEQQLREAFRLLKQGGLYVLSYADRSPDRITRFPSEKIEHLLSKVGFDNISSTAANDAENGDFHCTIAQKPIP